ncbi:MAG: hypothetical protein K2P81_17825, partial [Bacteriovoracaceae bacterium]|nr:hypothetical protein [Bacteriovoracaceae bacterium]
MNFNDDEYKLPIGQKAALVSLVCDKFPTHASQLLTQASMRELRELLRTLGLQAGNEYIQNVKNINPATMLGEGRIVEIGEEARAEGAQLLVFDFELTASQVRNIKK